MKAIYASKLYRSSKRKDVIKAALVNSANLGLVQQLADSLDDEYKDAAVPAKKKPQPEEKSSLKGPSGAAPAGGGGSMPSSFESGLDSDSFDPETDLVPFPEEADSESNSGGDKSVDESSQSDEINESTKVKAAAFLDVNSLNSLKDGLNLVDETSGVNRIVVKEGELWIYYSDSINLNNIMTDVIEYIDNLNRSLEFNRLARSDNAIVFEYVLSSSDSSEKEPNE